MYRPIGQGIKGIPKGLTRRCRMMKVVAGSLVSQMCTISTHFLGSLCLMRKWSRMNIFYTTQRTKIMNCRVWNWLVAVLVDLCGISYSIIPTMIWLDEWWESLEPMGGGRWGLLRPVLPLVVRLRTRPTRSGPEQIRYCHPWKSCGWNLANQLVCKNAVNICKEY